MGFVPRPALLASCVALAFGLAIAPHVFAASAGSAVGGVVRDALGRSLAGVEVLILPDRSPEALGSAITDEDGRFRVTEMPAGLYRIAALKPGYLASVTRANTFLRSTVDVVLHPVPRPGEPGGENVLARPSWVLRAPARSILREIEMREIARGNPVTAGPTGGGPVAEAAGAPALDLVEGQFRQLVALGGGATEAGSRDGPIVGGETSMHLTGALGQKGSVRLSGRRESLATSRAEFEGTPAGSRSAESLAFDISYETSRDTSLDVSAYYGHGDVRIGAVPEEPRDATREARRAWGYDARWTMQLDPASKFAVRLGYRDAALEVPSAYLPTFGTEGGASRSVSNRAIGASGSYEVLAGDNHLVRVGARAQALDIALPVLRDGGEAAFANLPGGAGWSIRLDAEDAWSVSGAWTLVYGLGVQQVLEGSDTTLFVPRTGVVWSPGKLHLEMALSYYAVTGWGEDEAIGTIATQGADLLSPVRPLGWEAEVAMPIAHGLSLRAGHRYEPLRDGARGVGELESPENGSPFVMGARAADRQNSLVLTRETGRVSASLAWKWGEAEGLIGQAAGFDLPVQIVSEREIAYRSGRFEVRLPASGTDLAVEYRRFLEAGSAGFASPFVTSSFELAMGQQIAGTARLGATCRLLLAARIVPSRGAADGSSMQIERARTLAALSQQVSAGLLVTF